VKCQWLSPLLGLMMRDTPTVGIVRELARANFAPARRIVYSILRKKHLTFCKNSAIL
jgi:hypothetical protein